MLETPNSCASGASMALHYICAVCFHAHTNSVICLVSGAPMTCLKSVQFQFFFQISMELIFSEERVA